MQLQNAMSVLLSFLYILLINNKYIYYNIRIIYIIKQELLCCKKRWVHTFYKQDQTSNRYDSILQWLQMKNGLVIADLLTHSHTPNLEMLSHLKITHSF